MKTYKWNFDGKEWELTCNMNVLAAVQEAYNGRLSEALTDSTAKSSLEFLAAMMNDYADLRGWPERYTAKQLGRGMDFNEFESVSHEVVKLLSFVLPHGADQSEGEETQTEPREEL